MEHKLPVISTNVGGISDEVKDGITGLTVASNDSNALAEAMATLFANPSLLKKMGEAGYQLFKKEFTESTFEQTLTNELKTQMGGVKLTSVNYWGRKYGSEKDVYWQNADIFVFPTLNEAFGLVLLEAMEYGIPCVATEEGGVSDIIENGKTGFIVHKKTAECLAEDIQKLLVEEYLRVSMGRNGRIRFEQLFTEERFERNMHRILTELVGV